MNLAIKNILLFANKMGKGKRISYYLIIIRDNLTYSAKSFDLGIKFRILYYIFYKKGDKNMAFCSKCGKEVDEGAEFCASCGEALNAKPAKSQKDGNAIARFLLTLFLGFIGSFIINHTELKPKGWRSRTLAYFILGIVTFGIYELVAAICNLSFDPDRESNVGYYKE